jgi:3-methyl-2-oxobutanoate hydroxymethyltransferase
MIKPKIKRILNKKNKTPLVCLSAYSKAIAEIADRYCDIILVGDSLGMVLYGMKSTQEVKIDTMIPHCKTVKKFTNNSLVVFDMPYKTYVNKFVAYKNANRVLKLTNCDGVKLEGGREVVNIIKYLVKKGIPVMGHIGLLPQSTNKFKLKGTNIFQKKQILNDAISLSNAGVFAIVIECVVESLAKKITSAVPIPTIGIGASKFCDGQILVTDDLIGLSNFKPKFVKQYSNIRKTVENSVKKYSSDVRLRKFPFRQNVYKL